LSIKKADPHGPIVLVTKGQQIEIVCLVEAENATGTTLSIEYNPAFLKLLNDQSEIIVGFGNFSKEFTWRFTALQASKGSMELQIQAIDQDLPQTARLRVAVAH
jgi:hypothetical protein